MLYDHLEGLYREDGREEDARRKKYGDICICTTDSLCYKAETNTPLESNYTPIKMFKKKKIFMGASQTSNFTQPSTSLFIKVFECNAKSSH